jgi:hypothetical protein
MINLTKALVLTLCFVVLFSCSVTVQSPDFGATNNNGDSGTIPPSFTSPETAAFTCSDLEEMNSILFVTFKYNKNYDLNKDGEVTVADKFIIEQKLREGKASCVVSARTCDDLQAVVDEVKTWSEWEGWSVAQPAAYNNLTLAAAYSIIFTESGDVCANDFGTGSFIGDVNKNNYLECDDALEMQLHIVGNPPVLSFDVALADINASTTVTGLDALIVKLGISFLMNHYATYLECPALP